MHHIGERTDEDKTRRENQGRGKARDQGSKASHVRR